MKSFKKYLLESKRDKSDPHEPKIRALATLGRLEHKYKDADEFEFEIHPDVKSVMSGRTRYGECDRVSHCVANRLRHTYPSVRVVYSKKFGQDYPEEPEILTGHSWVEIPETGHYIDPSHDMFRIHGGRTKIPMKGGVFPQSAIKIGKIGDDYHKKNYSTDRVIDPTWNPKK